MDTPNFSARLLKLTEAAERIRVVPDYLAKEIRLGRFSAYRVGREGRLSEAQLDQWLGLIEFRSKVA